MSLITIPSLQPSPRSREYDSYSELLRGEVIRAWVFEGRTHRAIDAEVLGLDAVYSRGYQSMGILHHLGLKKGFQALLRDVTQEEAINLLISDSQDFGEIVRHLKLTLSAKSVSLASMQEEEQKEIAEALADSSESRRNRLQGASTTPSRIRVYSYTYKRNADVVAEALYRALGKCEKCKQSAPFLRNSDGSPYLEVHHNIPLAKGGEDTLENVQALCPNCHRRVHFGD